MPPILDDLLAKCLAKEPRHRLTGLELADALRRVPRIDAAPLTRVVRAMSAVTATADSPAADIAPGFAFVLRADATSVSLMADQPTHFSRLERAAGWLGQRANLTPSGKWLQSGYLRHVSMRWVRFILERRMLVEGLAELRDLEPERGVLLVSNHRSFFDQFAALMAVMTYGARWGRHLSFPVRSEFFFDHISGLFLNYFVAGGAMYPPIYRDTKRQGLNAQSLDNIIELLATPGNLVGVHPEGTRGKGPDPYQLLPAQPGVGKIALLARPTVIPLFINGLSNDFVADVRANFNASGRRERTLIAVFGEPIDYSDLLVEKPRTTLYKKAADRMMRVVAELGQRERALREQCARGDVPADDERWLTRYRAVHR